MQQNRAKLALWVKLDKYGQIVPTSSVYRPIKAKGPQDGIWRKITSSFCCGTTDSYVIFRNNQATSNIISIVSTDGSINFTGLSIGNNGFFVIDIANGYDQTITVTMSSATARTMTNTQIYSGDGDTGVISSPGAFSTTSVVFTTSAQPSQQYLSVIT